MLKQGKTKNHGHKLAATCSGTQSGAGEGITMKHNQGTNGQITPDVWTYEKGIKMKIKHKAIFLSLLITLLTAISTTNVYAESSNRNEVRAEIAEGWEPPVWGDLINEWDYVLFIGSVASAIATENPGPIFEYFNYQLEEQLNKIRQTAPDILQSALLDLLIRAFDSQGQVLLHGRLEVSAGLATYNRWQDTWFGEIPLPNNFQPYFKFRWISSGGGGGGTAQTEDHIHFVNNCHKGITTAIHYVNLSGDWVTNGWWSLEPGESAFVAKTQNIFYYIYAKSFDGSLSWGGTDFYNSIRGSSKRYGFVKEEITSTSWGRWTQTFSCN